MRVARARRTGGAGSDGLFAIDDDRAVPLAAPPSADPLLELLRNGRDPATLEREQSLPLTDLQVLAPLARPGKIVAIGLNYEDHTAETGLDAPAEPLTFAKYPTSVIGPDAAIVVPAAITRQVDWEAELAVVIGRTAGPGRRATMSDVAGYTVANDVSARDLQFGDKQWTRGKSLDTFCPLGPYLVTADEVADPHALRIWARVNDELMQDATTADMIFDIPALLDFVSATVTLDPGDVILTGTPPGVGAFRTPPVFLADGDEVSVGVEGVGELRNPVRHV